MFLGSMMAGILGLGCLGSGAGFARAAEPMAVPAPAVPSGPLRIEGEATGIIEPQRTGPGFRAPQILQGYEDFHHPRLLRLRRDYRLDRVVRGETDELRRILKLRHWVHSQWPIDNDQRFSGDAFEILEKARTGAGFHCSHSMTVQYAVLSAMGFTARYVVVDRNHEDLGRSLHHGVNEVWSNDLAKWWCWWMRSTTSISSGEAFRCRPSNCTRRCARTGPGNHHGTRGGTGSGADG